MQASTFLASCPYEIGNIIEIISGTAGSSEELYVKTKAKITDIATIHCLKTGNVKFEYELDNCGYYQPL